MNQSEVNNLLKCFLQNNEPVSHLTAAHDDDDDHDHDDNMTLITSKAVAMLVLCCASTLCGSIPFVLNRCYSWTDNHTSARSATVVNCLLYFGGGVLLATTFLHLLPEVHDVVEELQHCEIIGELSFQLANLLMCCGFFLMYFIEEAMHAYVHRHHRDETSVAFERGHSVRNSHLMQTATPLPTSSGLASNSTISVQNLMSGDLEQQKYGAVHHHEQQLRPHPYNHSHGHTHSHGHNQGMNSTGSTDMFASSLRGLFIVLALSLHELFEGIAIGLEGSANAVWFMLSAVSAHKLVLAFCVGVELIVARTRFLLAVLYVLTFAVVSPLGIGIGILISHGHTGSIPSLVSALLQGLACGTLLYVVFFEILSKTRSGLRAYLALFVGFLIMFGLQQLGANDGHVHSHDRCSPSEHNLHRSAADNLGDSHKYEQQLQLLRQVTQKLLETHHSKHK